MNRLKVMTHNHKDCKDNINSNWAKASGQGWINKSYGEHIEHLLTRCPFLYTCCNRQEQRFMIRLEKISSKIN